jgi:hypothetical protein
VPRALDNGRRSLRKLLRAAVARLLGGRLRTQGTNPGVNERVAVVATLRPGSRERAAEIIARGAPYGPSWPASNDTASFWPMRRWSSFSKVPRLKDWFETSSMTGPAQPNSLSGPRYFRELPCSRVKSSTGKPASRSDTRAVVARLLGRNKLYPECLRKGRRRADNRRVLATRLTMTRARTMFFVFASFGLLLGAASSSLPQRPVSARQPPSFSMGRHIYSRICSASRSGGDS